MQKEIQNEILAGSYFSIIGGTTGTGRRGLWAFNEMCPEAPVTSLPFLLKWFGENAFSQKQEKMCRSVWLIRAVLNWICYKLCEKNADRARNCIFPHIMKYLKKSCRVISIQAWDYFQL